MIEQLLNNWLAALRSGELSQTTGRLSDGTSYCCLGVLCKVAGRELFASDEPDDDDVGPNAWNYRFVRETIGGRFTEGLTEMNDQGKTFLQIADFLEEQQKLREGK